MNQQHVSDRSRLLCRFGNRPRHAVIAILVLLAWAPGASPAAASHPAVPQAVGSWERTASVPLAPAVPHAVLLSDGRVFVMGGSDCSSSDPHVDSYCSGIEIYDPVLADWSSVSLPNADFEPYAAVVLPSGMVLCLGVAPSGVESYLYDPNGGHWSAAGTPPSGLGAQPMLEANGMVLVSSFPGIAEYSPATNSWRHFKVPLALIYYTSTLLHNGQLLVAGGEGCRPPGRVCNGAHLYDPVTSSWRVAGSMLAAREDHTATLLENGQVLVAGGYGCAPTYVCRSAELYDPATGRWSATGSMHQARAGQTAVLLADGRVLVAGGYGPLGGGYAHLPTAEIYDPSTGAWTQVQRMGVGREYASSTLLRDGSVLVVGGTTVCKSVSGCSATTDAELYAPAERSMAIGAAPAVVTPTSPARSQACATTPFRLGGAWRRVGADTRTWILAAPAAAKVTGSLFYGPWLPHTNGWMPGGETQPKTIWQSASGAPGTLNITARLLSGGNRQHTFFHLPNNGKQDYPRPGCWRLDFAQLGTAPQRVVDRASAVMLVLGD